MNELVDIVSTVGFPIAVCIYLLYERSQSTKDLKDAIIDLHILIASKCKEIE